MFPPHNIYPEPIQIFNHLSVIPPSVILFSVNTHTFTHDVCTVGGLGVSQFSAQNTNTLLRGHVSQIRPCRVTDIPAESTLHRLHVCNISNVAPKISAVLILTLLEIICSRFRVDPHYVMWSGRLFHRKQLQCELVCSCHEGKSNQDSKRRQSPVFGNRFLESQSVAVRNVCRSACVMFRWPVADMTVR